MHLEGLSFANIVYAHPDDNTSSNTFDSVWNVTVLRQLNNDIFRRLMPAIVVLATIMVVGVAGNVVICYIFIRKMRRSSQNLLLLTLGVFDLMSCCIGIPSEIYDMSHYYLYHSRAACKALRFLTTFPSLASILILLVIAADRYRKICKPLHPQIHLRHARIAIALVILVALLFSIPAIYLYGHRSFPTPIPGLLGHDCSVDDRYRTSMLPVAYEGVFAACFVLSTLVLVLLYVRIWLETRRHRKYMKTHASLGKIKLNDFMASSGCLDSSTDAVVDTGGVTSQTALSSRSSLDSDGSKKRSTRWRMRHDSKWRHLFRDEKREPEATERLKTNSLPAENGFSVEGDIDLVNSMSTDVKPKPVSDTNLASPNIAIRQSGVTFELYASQSADTNNHMCLDNGSCADDLHTEVSDSECDVKLIEDADLELSQEDLKTLDDATRIENLSNGTNPLDLHQDLELSQDDLKTLDDVTRRENVSIPTTNGTNLLDLHQDLELSQDDLKTLDDVTRRENVSIPTTNGTNHLDLHQDLELSQEDLKTLDDVTNRESTFLPTTNGTNILDTSLHKEQHSPTDDEEEQLKDSSRNTVHLNGTAVKERFENRCESANESTENVQTDSQRKTKTRLPAVVRRLQSSTNREGRLRKTKSSQSLYYAVRVKKALKATRMTVIACVITSGFILSYLPHLILIILRSVIISFEHNFDDASLVAYNIFLRSYFVNTVLNIFVYGSMNLEFRSALLAVWNNVKSPFQRDSSESNC